MEDHSMNRQTAIQTMQAKTVPTRQDAPRERRSEWSYLPAVDVYELPDGYVIECDAPGVKSDAIDLTYEAGELRLHGQVPLRYPGEGTFLRQEYGVGDFHREIPLGRLAEFIDGDRISAEYAHGVLTLRLPKLQAAQPKRIAVTNGQ
jgi:HSP20 family protein